MPSDTDRDLLCSSVVDMREFLPPQMDASAVFSHGPLASETVLWGKQVLELGIRKHDNITFRILLVSNSGFFLLMGVSHRITSLSMLSKLLIAKSSSRDGPHNKRRLVMIATCIVMYTMATAHWAIMFNWSQNIDAVDRKRMSEDVRTILRLGRNGTTPDCLDIPLEPNGPPSVTENFLPYVTPTVLLTVNVCDHFKYLRYRLVDPISD